MIVIPHKRMLYIHIPCTSGTALTEAISKSCPTARIWDAWTLPGQGDLFHMTAADSKKWFPDYRTFTILRNPWHTMASIWRRFRHAGIEPEMYQSWSDDFINYCRSLTTTSFEEFVPSYFAKRPQGFWKHWCDDDTIVFRYEDTPYEAIGELLELPLQVGWTNVNVSPVPAWTPEAIDCVARHCAPEIEMYGYAFSEV